MVAASPAFVGVSTVGDLSDGVHGEQITIGNIAGDLSIPRMGDRPLPVRDEYTVELWVRVTGQGRTRPEAMLRCGELTQEALMVLAQDPNLSTPTPMPTPTHLRANGISVVGPDFRSLPDGSGWDSSAVLSIALRSQSPC